MDPEVDTYSIKSGYKLTRELLDEGVDCTAIFALSDSMAIGAVRALIDAGKKVPEDISVAGFDGTEMAAYYNPAITTIRQPAEIMAKETIKLLFDSIKKKTKVQQLIFDGELVPGESVKKRKGMKRSRKTCLKRKLPGFFLLLFGQMETMLAFFRKPFSGAVDKVCQMK